jgi:hypothetical protein
MVAHRTPAFAERAERDQPSDNRSAGPGSRYASSRSAQDHSRLSSNYRVRGGVVIVDDLNALLHTRRWVKRRVDRVEFLDLMTVRRTIALTIDLDQLRCVRTSCCGTSTGSGVIPLGWFVPWANAGAVMVDADERMIPYLTSRESDEEVEKQIRRRLDAINLDCLKPKLGTVVRHRRDPGRPGDECVCCKRVGCSPGHQELMVDKWGCRAVLALLSALHTKAATNIYATELARILLAWQRNFVLFARLDASSMQRGRVTLRLSYDEELLEWEPPWEHRRRLVRKPEKCQCKQPVECRAYISRGGPFYRDLDLLAPKGPYGVLAQSRSPYLRKLGRRDPLHVTWHVAWHQASGLNAPDHHVDVVLPNELAAVRMRMLRMTNGNRCATVADQVGSHATIVAPENCDNEKTAEQETRCDQPAAQNAQRACAGRVQNGRQQDDGAWSPTLFSLVIARRSPAMWYGGAWIACLTAIALLLVATLWLPEVVEHVDAGVATLLLAPTLAAAVLSVRAASEIAEQLTTMLRRLIGVVGVLTAACALALVVQPGPPEPNLHQKVRGETPPIHHLWPLRGVWFGAAVLLLLVAAALLAGGLRIKCLLAFGRRPAPRYVPDSELTPGKMLNPNGAKKIGPPDRWLNADEGDLVPWGWLNGASSFDITKGSDALFWSGHRSTSRPLTQWVREIVHYKEPPLYEELSDQSPCPQCRCC